jgi:tRNA threonylcarbamoyladenosine biosynthesis protein TsaE
MRKLKHFDLNLGQLKKLAQNLGAKSKSKNLTIGLSGDLGSGKTTFVKSFAKAYGIRRITSPTFTVLGSYRYDQHDIYHLDFYRLKKMSELEEIGINEILRQKNRTMLIEWVDKFPKIMKACDLNIKFKITKNNKRNVTINYL